MVVLTDLLRPATRHACRRCHEQLLHVYEACPQCGARWAGVRPARYAARLVLAAALAGLVAACVLALRSE
jgi:lipopolysaccharide biosynthesis regulator YciM